MKLVVDIPDRTLERVRAAIQSTDYDNPNEFVITALENQIELESSEKGVENNIQSFEQFFSDSKNDANNVEDYSPTDLENRDYSDISVSEQPGEERLENGPLWGQYNRIFPVKFAVRRLANMLIETESNQIELENFQSNVSTLARKFGLRLKEIDTENKRGRGEKLASALPVGDDSYKSKERYQEQFVGRIDNEGNLSGASPSLQFINISRGGFIMITEPGLSFAALHNPLLDTSIRQDKSLSQEETKFYLNHVAESVPNEFAAMERILVGIREGKNRPQSLTEEIAKMDSGWTDAQADTMRTGLIGRMYELNLIARNSVGQRGVSYEITQYGNRVFDRNVGVTS